MLVKKKEIKELYDLKHHNDSYPKGFNYFDSILKKTVSPYVFQNDNTNGFLLRLEPIMALFFDKVNVMRNWKNWYVDKYKNDHIK